MKLVIAIFSLVLATNLSAPLNLVYPHVHPFNIQPTAYAAPSVHVVHAIPAVDTRVHYAETPVLVGHSAQILKPNLAPYVVAPFAAPLAVVEAKKENNDPMETVEETAPVADPVPVKTKKDEEVPIVKDAEEVKISPVSLTYVSHHPFALATPHIAYAVAPTVLDLKAPIPAGDTPPMDVLVTKERVLAPVRAISEVIPQVTIQHPTKVNIEKFAVEVPVATTYALPVPYPLASHYEIHHVHTPALW